MTGIVRERVQMGCTREDGSTFLKILGLVQGLNPGHLHGRRVLYPPHHAPRATVALLKSSSVSLTVETKSPSLVTTWREAKSHHVWDLLLITFEPALKKNCDSDMKKMIFLLGPFKAFLGF